MPSPKPKKSEIIKIHDQVWVVFDLKKDYLEGVLLQTLEKHLETNGIIPRFQIDYQTIEGYETLDSDMVLWWLHSKNPLIKKIVENFFNEKEQGRPN